MTLYAATAGWEGSQELPAGYLDLAAPPAPRAPWWRSLAAWCGLAILRYLGAPR